MAVAPGWMLLMLCGPWMECRGGMGGCYIAVSPFGWLCRSGDLTFQSFGFSLGPLGGGGHGFQQQQCVKPDHVTFCKKPRQSSQVLEQPWLRVEKIDAHVTLDSPWGSNLQHSLENFQQQCAAYKVDGLALQPRF